MPSVHESMESKAGTMSDKEMDTGKKTVRKRQNPHQRAGSNTGSLRTPKSKPNSMGTERGWSAVKSLPCRKYDIDTLMTIGKNSGMGSSIVSKFSSHSVENNIIRHNGSSRDRILTDRRTNRPRGESRASIGNAEEYSSVQESNFKHPSRQPRNAPQGQLAQTNAGFARFLKEHASPKHQRVTAGGRIVPMDPSSPAPKFNLPSGNPEQEGKEKARKSRTAHLSSESSSFGGFSSIETRPSGEPGIRSEAKGKAIQEHCNSEAPGHPQASSVPEMAKANLQHQLPPHFVQRPQAPMNMMPVSLWQGHMSQGASFVGLPQPNTMLPSFTQGTPTGSAINSNEQGSQSDQNLNQQLLGTQYLPIFTQQPIQGMFNPQVGNITGLFQPVPNMQIPISSGTYQLPNVGAHYTTPQIQTMPNTAQTSASFPQDPAANNNSLLDVTREYESLTDQLSNLDRYLALHTWDIDPATKRALVDQRKDLVMKIDSARTNKELLESSLNAFKTGVTTGTQNNPSRFFQINQDQAHPSIRTPRAGFENHSWNPNPALHGPHISGSDVASTPTPITAYASSTLTPTISTQDSELGQTHYGAGAAGFEEQMPFVNSVQHSMESQSWYYPQNCIGKDADGDGYHSSTTHIPTCLDDGDDWSTPKKPAPPSVSRVYSRIEEAAKDGATVEKLLQDLALVTAKLNEARAARQNSSGNQPLQPAAEIWTPKSHENIGYNGRNSGQSQYLQERNIPNSKGSAQQNITSGARPQRPTIGKDGKDRVYMAQPCEIHRDAVGDASGEDDGDEEGDGGSCYSDESTNSWATIEVGDKRWVARENTKAKDPKESEEPSTQGQSRYQHREFVERDGDAAPCGHIKNVKPQKSGGSRTVSLRHTTEWVKSVNSDGVDKHGHDQLQAPGSQSKKSPKQSQTSNKEHNKRNDIFALGPWSRSSESSQKVGTSTEFQNVNAHAFLPPFDGAGDTRPSNHNPAETKGNAGQGQPKSSATEPPQKWYIKPQRETPSPFEVRKFFRSIEEEERLMVEKYRARQPF